MTLITNDDNVVRASVWFEFLVDYFNARTCDMWEGHMTTRSEIQTKNLGFWDKKRRSDIKDVDITGVV